MAGRVPAVRLLASWITIAAAVALPSPSRALRSARRDASPASALLIRSIRRSSMVAPDTMMMGKKTFERGTGRGQGVMLAVGDWHGTIARSRQNVGQGASPGITNEAGPSHVVSERAAIY
jgi:hypothetical protein